MTVVAAAICPHPPLLLPGATGAAAPENVAPGLVGACRAAVRYVLYAEDPLGVQYLVSTWQPL